MSWEKAQECFAGREEQRRFVYLTWAELWFQDSHQGWSGGCRRGYPSCRTATQVQRVSCLWNFSNFRCKIWPDFFFWKYHFLLYLNCTPTRQSVPVGQSLGDIVFGGICSLPLFHTPVYTVLYWLCDVVGQLDAVYLITDGQSTENCRELLRQQVLIERHCLYIYDFL